jgi:hypothetical protein
VKEKRIRDGNCSMLLTVGSDLSGREKTDNAGEDRATSVCKEWHPGTCGKSGLGNRLHCRSRLKVEDIIADAHR